MKRFTFLLRPCTTLNDGAMQWTTGSALARTMAEARAKLEADGLDVGGLWSVDDVDQH